MEHAVTVHRAGGELGETSAQMAGQALLAAFMQGKSERTIKAYTQDLEQFAAFLGTPTVAAAAARLLALELGPANALTLEYRTWLTARGLSNATVNRRLAALRSAMKLGRTLGLTPHALEVGNLKATKYRDTRGPGVTGFERMLHATPRATPKGKRDRAIIWLLFGTALRRAEVAGLDLADLEWEAGLPASAWILGKGQDEKERVTLPEPVGRALAGWVELRGREPGALFTSLDRARKGSGRISGEGIRVLVARLGKKAGLGVVRPHGLRHAGITAALDAGVDVREVRKYSRHKRIETVLIYDDNRQDLGGKTASRVARLVNEAA